MVQQKLDYRKIFLQELTLTIINQIAETKMPTLTHPIENLSKANLIGTRKPEKYIQAPQIKIRASELKPPQVKIQTLGLRSPRVEQPPINYNQPMPINQLPPGKILTVGKGLEKLEPLLKNPAILSVECSGPEKPLLINLSGKIQATPYTLTKQEIDEIIEDISQKTKIPVISGLFKTFMGGLSINAVISQFAGTRFIIQKRNPLTMPNSQMRR